MAKYWQAFYYRIRNVMTMFNSRRRGIYYYILQTIINPVYLVFSVRFTGQDFNRVYEIQAPVVDNESLVENVHEERSVDKESEQKSKKVNGYNISKSYFLPIVCSNKACACVPYVVSSIFQKLSYKNLFFRSS